MKSNVESIDQVAFIASEDRSPPYLLYEFNIFVAILGVVDWFPRPLRDMDESQSNLLETVSRSNSLEGYWGGCVQYWVAKQAKPNSFASMWKEHKVTIIIQKFSLFG